VGHDARLAQPARTRVLRHRRPNRVGDGDDERPTVGGSAAPIARSPGDKGRVSRLAARVPAGGAGRVRAALGAGVDGTSRAVVAKRPEGLAVLVDDHPDVSAYAGRPDVGAAGAERRRPGVPGRVPDHA